MPTPPLLLSRSGVLGCKLKLKAMKNIFKVEVGNWPFDHFVTTQSGRVVAKLKMPNYSTSINTLEDTLKLSNENIEVVKNAKLLAAAPKLLENLIRCVDRLEENGMGDMSAVRRAKEVIKSTE